MQKLCQLKIRWGETPSSRFLVGKSRLVRSLAPSVLKCVTNLFPNVLILKGSAVLLRRPEISAKWQLCTTMNLSPGWTTVVKMPDGLPQRRHHSRPLFPQKEERRQFKIPSPL